MAYQTFTFMLFRNAKIMELMKAQKDQIFLPLIKGIVGAPLLYLPRAVNLETTRMHSSRMHTARSLIVSHCIPCMPPPNNHTHTLAATMHAPPGSNHACPLEATMHNPPRATTHTPPRATMHAPQSNHACPPGATTHTPLPLEQPHMPPPRSNHARPWEQPCTSPCG